MATENIKIERLTLAPVYKATIEMKQPNDINSMKSTIMYDYDLSRLKRDAAVRLSSHFRTNNRLENDRGK